VFDLTLTFDNGPEPDVTPRVLDILRERGIEIPNISKQTIATRLNGAEVQAAPISDSVFDVPAPIAYCSTSLSSSLSTSSSPAPPVAPVPTARSRSG
jgi:hypothetical protein